jgi:putative sterol carrier protein
VARFYSAEWVDEFNRAVFDLDLSHVETGALGADGKAFAVAQLVHGGPDGELRVVLSVDSGRLHLRVGQAAEAEVPPAQTALPAVTISLSYEDAAALSRGDLDPAEALGLGRVRVRGDLAVLVAGQALLAAAAERLQTLQTSTTY